MEEESRGALHAVDERKPVRVRVVVAKSGLAAEMKRERQFVDIDKRKRVDQPRQLKGAPKAPRSHRNA